MNFKMLAVACAAAAASSGALATDVVIDNGSGSSNQVCVLAPCTTQTFLLGATGSPDPYKWFVSVLNLSPSFVSKIQVNGGAEVAVPSVVPYPPGTPQVFSLNGLSSGGEFLVKVWGGTNTTGTNFAPTVTYTLTQAIPEPETYALMLAGLAAVGFMARRRKA